MKRIGFGSGSWRVIVQVAVFLTLLALNSPLSWVLAQQLDQLPLPGAAAQPPTGTDASTDPANGLRPGQTQPPAAEAAVDPTQPTQPPAEAPVENARELLKQRVLASQAALQADTESPPESKEALAKLYQQALVDLNAADQASSQRIGWIKKIESAPQLLQSARERKEKAKENGGAGPVLFLSFEEGQTRLRQLEAELATATAERTRLSDQVNSREKRKKELPQLISDAKAKLDQIAKQPSSETLADDPLLQEAVTMSAQASRMALVEQLASMEAESRAYEAEAALLPLQLELAQAEERRLQERVRLVNEELNRIRQDRILTKRSELYELIQGLPQNLRPSGEAVFDRITSWLDLASKQASVKEELESTKAVLNRWKDRRDKMETKIDSQPGASGTAGFNVWVGLMLRQQRTELPDPNQLSSRLRYYQTEVQKADALAFDLDDALIDINVQQEQLLSAGDESDPKRSMLLEKSKEILEAMKLDVDAYLTDLYAIADMKLETRQLVYDYRAFIDKHVLWIRSSDQLKRADLKVAVEAFRWLVDYRNWINVFKLLWGDLIGRPWWYVLFVVGMGVLVVNQARMRRQIGKFGTQADRKTCTLYRATGQTVILTLLTAIPAPLFLLFFHWRIHAAAEIGLLSEKEVGFPNALSSGLLLGVVIFFPMELLRQVCRIDGLGIKHFEWDEAVTRRVAANLRWLIDLVIPFSVVLGTISAVGDSRWDASMGRVVFIALMPLLSLFFARIFAPYSGVLSAVLKQYPGGWLDRLRYVWYAAIVAGPLILMVVSFIGFHYTAQRIAIHFSSTLWAMVILVVSYFLIKRWLVLSRRKLIMAQARQRLEDAAARRDAGTSVGALPTLETPEVNLVALNEQTRRLLTTVVYAVGLMLVYYIWSDVLPAIQFLDNFELWHIGDGPEDRVPITLSNLLLVIPIVVLAIIAQRNLPGVLEIGFLQHLPLTDAARYAITTLTRYIIVALGISIAAGTLGLKWQSIQWLVAALGVGLGFGLQEIFANFVSGVILLFEQPIRVGDIITIDGTTGTVSRIRMRATTIVNWERQELIVPNKDLITGKLLNWTLTDTTNRIVLNVGVAYGSDTRRACELIRELCAAHENVLRDPEPVVTFEGFGDNTLNLVLRAYLGSLEFRLKTVHELHEQIYLAFNEAGIEIAFPQRDLHIRSLPESLTKWLGRPTA